MSIVACSTRPFWLVPLSSFWPAGYSILSSDFVHSSSFLFLHLICTITSSSDSLLCSSFLPFLFGVYSLLTTCLILALLIPFSLLFLKRPFPAATVSASLIRQYGSHFCQGQRGHQSWSSGTSHYSSRTLSKCCCQQCWRHYTFQLDLKEISTDNSID